MGLFDIFRKKKSEEEKPCIPLAMPLFMNGESFEVTKVIDHLRQFWKLEINQTAGKETSAVLTVNGNIIALAPLPAPVPWGDIEGTAKYAYNWPEAATELKDHTGHAIVTVMAGSGSAFEKYSLLTKVLHSVLSTSNAVGVYQGNESLLIPRSQYLETAEMLNQNMTPVPLWVYVGVRKNGNKNSLYTYGLKSFGKTEMEILDSMAKPEDLYEFLLNICAYVIKSNVTLNPGETFGYTADQKIQISGEKGSFTEGQVLRLGL